MLWFSTNCRDGHVGTNTVECCVTRGVTCVLNSTGREYQNILHNARNTEMQIFLRYSIYNIIVGCNWPFLQFLEVKDLSVLSMGCVSFRVIDHHKSSQFFTGLLVTKSYFKVKQFLFYLDEILNI